MLRSEVLSLLEYGGILLKMPRPTPRRARPRRPSPPPEERRMWQEDQVALLADLFEVCEKFLSSLHTLVMVYKGQLIRGIV